MRICLSRTLAHIILFAGITAFFTGCLSPGSDSVLIVSGATEYDENGAEVMRISLDTSNSELSHSIEVTGLKTVMTESGYLKVSAGISSKVNYDQSIQYKFSWLDASGMEVGSGMSAWRRLIVHGKDSVQISNVAPYKEAVSFKLSIRK